MQSKKSQNNLNQVNKKHGMKTKRKLMVRNLKKANVFFVIILSNKMIK